MVAFCSKYIALESNDLNKGVWLERGAVILPIILFHSAVAAIIPFGEETTTTQETATTIESTTTSEISTTTETTTTTEMTITALEANMDQQQIFAAIVSGEDKSKKVTFYIYPGSSLIAEKNDDGLGYYHTVYPGSPRAMSDFTGAVTWQQDYTPYGSELRYAEDLSGISFTGHRSDDTGLDYAKQRYYDPLTSTFTQTDVMDGPMNGIYGYAAGNPLRSNDPTGKIRHVPTYEEFWDVPDSYNGGIFDGKSKKDIENKKEKYTLISGRALTTCSTLPKGKNNLRKSIRERTL